MLFENLKMAVMEAGLNLQNAAENACIHAKVACTPVQPLKNQASSEDSKGCESEKKSEDEYEVTPSGESLFSRVISGNPGFNIKKQPKEENDNVKDTKSESKSDDVKDTKSEEKKNEKKSDKTESSKSDVKDTKSETKTEAKENSGANRSWESTHIKDKPIDGNINIMNMINAINEDAGVNMGFQSPVGGYVEGFNQFVQPQQNYQQPIMNQQPSQQIPNYQQPVNQQMPNYQQPPIQQYPYNNVQPQQPGYNTYMPNAAYMHKSDAPVQQPNNQRPPKAAPDKVDSNINLNLHVTPEEKDVKYKIAEQDAIKNANIPTQEPVQIDNSEVIKKYPNLHLDEIEKIATEKGCKIKMIERKSVSGMPIGLIDCFTSYNDVYAAKKSFSIDTGNIIDRRAKLFPEILQYGYERLQAYPLKVRSNSKEDKKQVFNKEIFENIFVGGVDTLPDRGLYSPERRELNQAVNLISMPTKDMTADDRKAVMKRLEDAYKAGVFNVSNYYKNSNHEFRFMFKDNSYNKNTKTFTLINTAPLFYNGPYNSTSKILINFGVNGKTTVSVMK